jgi:hypothetical protein
LYSLPGGRGPVCEHRGLKFARAHPAGSVAGACRGRGATLPAAGNATMSISLDSLAYNRLNRSRFQYIHPSLSLRRPRALTIHSRPPHPIHPNHHPSITHSPMISRPQLQCRQRSSSACTTTRATLGWTPISTGALRRRPYLPWSWTHLSTQNNATPSPLLLSILSPSQTTLSPLERTRPPRPCHPPAPSCGSRSKPSRPLCHRAGRSCQPRTAPRTTVSQPLIMRSFVVYPTCTLRKASSRQPPPPVTENHLVDAQQRLTPLVCMRTH